MYSAGVPEKMIMKRSEHMSKEGVRSCEWTTTKQEKVLSGLISSPTATYSEAVKSVHSEQDVNIINSSTKSIVRILQTM